MSYVDGICRCDVCKVEISGTDIFLVTALEFDGQKHICRMCVDDFKKRSSETKVVSYEQVEEYASENGNRLGRDGSSAGSVLDELLK